MEKFSGKSHCREIYHLFPKVFVEYFVCDRKAANCFGVPWSVLEGYQKLRFMFQCRQHNNAFLYAISYVDVNIFENIIMTDMMTVIIILLQYF